MHSLRVLTLIFCLGATLLINSVQADPQADIVSIRSAFISKMIPFVEWPEAKPAIEIAIINDKESADSLTKFFSGSAGRQPASLVTVTAAEKLPASANVVYIGNVSPTERQKILAELKKKPVLTISHADGAAQDGVIVNFFEEDKKIRFEINMKKAKEANLKISSQLLKLAKIVGGE